MTKTPRKLPKTASIAIPQSGAKLHAPSAARNVEPILQAITPFLPARGRVLEIASGTGEHIARYAAAFPNLRWQPTDIEPARLASIDAWGKGLPNLLPAKHLDAAHLDATHLDATHLDATHQDAAHRDASQRGWAAAWPKQDVILFSNLLHLISDSEAKIVLEEATLALASGGVLIIYGPFLRGDKFASEGDERFHESLQGQDPDIGYKSHQWVQGIISSAGLAFEPLIEMPASNLLLVARKP